MVLKPVSVLVPRQGNLGVKMAAALLRRSSFRFTKEKVDELKDMNATAAVDVLFDSVSPASYIDRPRNYEEPSNMDWIPLETNNRESLRRQYVSAWWFQNALLDPTAHHKTAYFLHTIFATTHVGTLITNNLNKNVSRYLFDHVRVLNWLTDNGRTLKEAAFKMTRDNWMLCFLDNRLNSGQNNDVANLNENYAREFLELFTIGAEDKDGNENYEESDITMAARVFSGYVCEGVRTNSQTDADHGHYIGTATPVRHWTGDKQFGNLFSNAIITGSSNPNEADMIDEINQFIDMVFGQRATAENYATKIYRFYVSNTLDPAENPLAETVIQELADDLEANGYSYIETIKLLLSSDHFYSLCAADYGGGNLVKAPLEILAESMSFFGANLSEITDPNDVTQIEHHYRKFGSIYMFNKIGENASQKLFGPPDVAGHPAYHQEPMYDKNWYSPGTLAARYGIGSTLVKFNSAIYTEIDTLTYVHDLLSAGVPVWDATVLTDLFLEYLSPIEVSVQRRDFIKQLFTFTEGIGGDINWHFEWVLYNGGVDPDGVSHAGDGDEDRVRPHLDALVISILSSQEFQLK